MPVESVSVALSGLRSAQTRLQTSSHNVANLLTKDFHPQRTIQSSEAAGGSSARVESATEPQPVDLAGEIVQQELAGLQARASLRVAEIGLDLLEDVVDLGD